MTPELQAAIRTSVEVAERLRERRDALRRALEKGDVEAVVACARRLLGMEDDESDCASPRIDRGAGRS